LCSDPISKISNDVKQSFLLMPDHLQSNTDLPLRYVWCHNPAWRAKCSDPIDICPNYSESTAEARLLWDDGCPLVEVCFSQIGHPEGTNPHRFAKLSDIP